MKKERPGIGIQLYTLRNELQQDFEGTLRALAETMKVWNSPGTGERTSDA